MKDFNLKILLNNLFFLSLFSIEYYYKFFWATSLSPITSIPVRRETSVKQDVVYYYLKTKNKEKINISKQKNI